MIYLVSGFLGGCSDWDEVAAELGGRECRRIGVLDLATAGADESAMERAAQRLSAIVSQSRQSGEECVVCGYSMGGRIALHALPILDESVQVILVSASPGLHGAADRRARASLDAARAARLVSEGISAFVNEWYSQELFNSLRCNRHFADIRRRRVAECAAESDAWAWALRSLSPGLVEDGWEHLERFGARVQFVSGALDDAYTSLAEPVQRLGVRTAVIPNAGHAAHLESPAALAAIITRTLAEAPTARATT